MTMIRKLIVAVAVLLAPLGAAAVTAWPAAASSSPSTWRACRWGCVWGNYAVSPTWHVMYRYTKTNEYGERENCTVYWDWATDTIHETCS